MKKNQIKLTKKERTELEEFCTKGVRSVRLARRARIILAPDISVKKKAESAESIAKRIGVSRQAIYDVQNDFLNAENTAMFLQRKKRETPPVPPKITGEAEAGIIALACSKAPEGYARWTLRLLTDKCVELQFCDTISAMTIQRILKKTNLSLI